jgi:hypothetical protein
VVSVARKLSMIEERFQDPNCMYLLEGYKTKIIMPKIWAGAQIR